MIKPMFGHRPKPKKFNMPLRYYKPEEEERRKRRISIKMNRRRPKQGAQVFIYAIGLAIVVWVISVL